MLTVKDIANQLNLSQGAVYKAITSGELEHHRFGASIRITEAQLERYLEKTRARQVPRPEQSKEFKHLDL